MTLYVWPWRLLVPSSQLVRIGEGSVISGPEALDGLQQATSTAAGGKTRASLLNIPVRTPDQLRCAQAWAAHLAEGVTECIVPLPMLYSAPRPYAGGKPMRPGSSAPTTDYFGQEASLGSPMMVATAAAALLRATELVITVSQGARLRGGERLSIDHGGTVGWRTYRIARVVAVAGTAHTVKIRSPLRAAIGASTPIEFDVPRCVMRLDPAKADELEPELRFNRGMINAHFIESFNGGV